MIVTISCHAMDWTACNDMIYLPLSIPFPIPSSIPFLDPFPNPFLNPFVNPFPQSLPRSLPRSPPYTFNTFNTYLPSYIRSPTPTPSHHIPPHHHPPYPPSTTPPPPANFTNENPAGLPLASCLLPFASFAPWYGEQADMPVYM